MSTLQSIPRRIGGEMLVKSDMVSVIKDALQLSFTRLHVKASFHGAGLWPVKMHLPQNELRGSVAPATQLSRGSVVTER